MGKGGLLIDVITGPASKDEEDFEDAVDDTETEESPARADPEALIAGIESQLAKLRAALGG